MPYIPGVNIVDHLFGRVLALFGVTENIQHVNDAPNNLQVAAGACQIHNGTVASHEHWSTHVNHWVVFGGFSFGQTFWNYKFGFLILRLVPLGANLIFTQYSQWNGLLSLNECPILRLSIKNLK